jgi:hypothetical protein
MREVAERSIPDVASLIRATLRPEPATNPARIACITKPHEMPVLELFTDKEGTGWHVIIRYREAHECRIEGFASKDEAVDWRHNRAVQFGIRMTFLN